MAQLAPELPSTGMLHEMYPISEEGIRKVHEKRIEANTALKFGRKLLVIAGPCAMSDDLEAILDENRQLTEFGEAEGITILHRVPPWKPRTNPEAWHGLDTSDPETAHRIATAIAEQNGNLAMEFGHPSHVERFLARTALAWRGSRNDQDNELLVALRQSDTALPIAIKNGMSGQIYSALLAAEELSTGREAPSVLLFRGGEDFTTPGEWVAQLQHVTAATDGIVIVDAAHGGEMAHDPNGRFGKSEAGQLACIDSVIENTNKTKRIPRGIMLETSNLTTPTDPVIPLEQALEKLEELAYVHRKLQNS